MNNTFFASATVALTALLASPASAADLYDRDLEKQKVEVMDDNGDSWNLTRVFHERVVDATPEEAWQSLADYGGVAHVSPTIYKAGVISDNAEFAVGCERFCSLEFQGRDIYIEERIIELVEGEHYTYDVYEWENFPLRKMFVTFGVKTNDMGETVLYNIVDYQLKPRIMTGMMKGQMADSARTGVLAYKHFTETGKGGLGPDDLVAMYGE